MRGFLQGDVAFIESLVPRHQFGALAHYLRRKKGNQTLSKLSAQLIIIKVLAKLNTTNENLLLNKRKWRIAKSESFLVT